MPNRRHTFGFTAKELQILRRLNTPKKIQNFLNQLPFNDELDGETCHSPRMVLKTGIAHCMEGAMLAAAALRIHGYRPLLVDLRATAEDDDHEIAVFGGPGHWGAISKTGSAVLRYREPIYRNIRELVMSFFHEYFTHKGKKTLRSYSMPVDLRHFDKRGWMTSGENLWVIANHMNRVPHHSLLTAAQAAHLRKADPIEIKAGKLLDTYPHKKKRTR